MNTEELRVILQDVQSEREKEAAYHNLLLKELQQQLEMIVTLCVYPDFLDDLKFRILEHTQACLQPIEADLNPRKIN